MTEISKEVIDNYQIRKTKEQKSAFISFLESFATAKGYKFSVEKGDFGCRNIVIGDLSTAKAVYTAHYDTCAEMPFPNFVAPKAQGLIMKYIFILGFAVGIICGFMSTVNPEPEPFKWQIFLYVFGGIVLVNLLIMLFSIFGKANENTANDNTSGVTVLLNIINTLSKEQKPNVAFVFFDLEEVGMIGSSAFARKHKKEIRTKLLVNFDCVSDGEYMLFALREKAKPYKEAFEKAFQSNEKVTVDIATSGVFYPSDQMNFPLGVGVAALKKSKRFSVLYMNRIHTKRDTVYREENISFLTNGAIKLLKFI